MTEPHAIERLTQRIADDFGYSVHLCGEIEIAFVSEEAIPDSFWQALLDAAKADGVLLESIGREKTDHPSFQQYECRFGHTSPREAAEHICWLNFNLGTLAMEQGHQLLSPFYSDEAGIANGLHWHLHLLDEQGQYVFIKRDEELSESLSHVLGGLLETLPFLMTLFAPQEESYRRLNSDIDHVPRTCSWGGNNRSCALRLPESVIPLRHIEHRVCGADADPLGAVWALLVGIHYGLRHHLSPGSQCFGDANREGYPSFPLSFDEAESLMGEASEWLTEYARS